MHSYDSCSLEQRKEAIFLCKSISDILQKDPTPAQHQKFRILGKEQHHFDSLLRTLQELHPAKNHSSPELFKRSAKPRNTLSHPNHTHTQPHHTTKT